MLNKLAVLSLVCMALLTSCMEEEPEIRTACDTNQAGDYLIKWETFPPMDGIVRIYESHRPDSFNAYSPIAEQEIPVGYKSVFSTKTNKRSYFQLIFDKKYSVITAERAILADKVFNIRDLGGYYSNDKKQTQWGKLYRSSSLAQATPHDVEILNELGIKSIIDLRSEREFVGSPSRYRVSQIFSIPLRRSTEGLFFNKVLSGEIRKGDVLILNQDNQAYMIEHNRDYFSQMFDILLNASNYPMMMYCSLGSDRTGMAAALVLAALGVDSEQIVQDYLLSNYYIDYHKLIANVEDYPEEIQETLTTFLSVQEETIRYVFNRINKDYGSMDHYLEKELGLTSKKREKLKDLLLYQHINENKQ